MRRDEKRERGGREEGQRRERGGREEGEGMKEELKKEI